MASLNQEATENDSRSTLLISAPSAGRISALPVNAGQTVQAGQTVASLVPLVGPGQPAELQAQLFAPSRTAGFVQPGQVAHVRFQAFPFQKFGMAKGIVIAVSQSPIAPSDLPPGQTQSIFAAVQANEPMYRITVLLPRQTVNTYGHETALTPGMSVDADVRQHSRKVWEWLLEPALATLVISKSVR